MIVLYLIVGILVVLYLICWINTKRKKVIYTRENATFKAKTFPIVIDAEAKEKAVIHLQKALTFRTVAEDCLEDKTEFIKLHTWMKMAYPLVFKNLKVQLIEGQNIIFEWQGSDNSLSPFLLMAHQDVVTPGDLDKWKHPPFAGEIEDGYLYGRGTIDIKSQVTAILESFETLLRKKYKPKRTIFAAFSENEEIFGEGGPALVKYFQKREIDFDFILDEGGAVSEDFLAMVDKPIAVVGVGEKIAINVKMEVELSGGHSSTPKNPTSLGVLAKAIAKVETHQEKSNITPLLGDFLHNVGCNAKGFISIAMLNLWLFKPVILSVMKKQPNLIAFFRNTHTVTTCKGSTALNAIPSVSTANANCRLLPKNLPEEELKWLNKIINDERVELKIAQAGQKSKISDYKCSQFQGIENTIKTLFGDVVVTPYLMAGGSDARHYNLVSDKIYRFSPYQVTKAELGLMHNYNERISLENIDKMVSFYLSLIQYFA